MTSRSRKHGSWLAMVVLALSLCLESGPLAEAQSQSSQARDTPGIELELAWKRPLGSGNSRVSVADGKAITLFSDGLSDWMVALEVPSGLLKCVTIPARPQAARLRSCPIPGLQKPPLRP